MRLAASFVLAPALFALGLFGAACQTTVPLPSGADNPGLVEGDLMGVNPLDIVVLPVENHTAKTDLPLDTLRRGFHAGLVDRHYSPLALEYVDRRVTEASYSPGGLDEQALLKVVITGWDDSFWDIHSRLTIDADVWLLDPNRPSEAEALWGGHVTRRMEMSQVRAATATEANLMEIVVDQFTESVMGSLRPRNSRITQP